MEHVHTDLVSLTQNSDDLTIKQLKQKFAKICKKHKIKGWVKKGKNYSQANPTHLMCVMTFTELLNSSLQLDLCFPGKDYK